MNASRNFAFVLATALFHIAVVGVATAPTHAQQTVAEAARVDAVFARWNSAETPGCAVGVSRAGTPVLQRAYGMADLEHGIRNTPATIFEAGSVSKQFTAAAVVLLAQQGLLSLDDDVRRYVPELPDHGTPVLIRHMLNHTSGLRDWGSVAAISGWGRSNRTHTHDHVVDILSRQRGLNFTPGHEYSYSNSGYNLAAVIVARVSGMSFAEFSRRHIFEPLGLRNTQWRDDYTRIVPGRSSAYAQRAGGFVIDRPIENVHGNGGLLTTVGDLLTWNEALAEGRIGGPDFVRLMHERGMLNDGSQIQYARGITVGSYGGVPEVSHTGSTSGYRAFLARYPDQGVGVALLCNVGAVNPGAVGHEVADIFLGDAVRRPAPRATTAPAPPAAPAAAQARPEPVRLTSAQLAELTGEYYSPDAEVGLTVSVEDGRLVALRRPATRMTLNPAADDVFESGIGRIRFIRDASGRVTQLSVQQARVYDLRFDRVQQ
jgi:CubicO group peptidase (beta-lactamase class C family)